MPRPRSLAAPHAPVGRGGAARCSAFRPRPRHLLVEGGGAARPSFRGHAHWPRRSRRWGRGALLGPSASPRHLLVEGGGAARPSCLALAHWLRRSRRWGGGALLGPSASPSPLASGGGRRRSASRLRSRLLAALLAPLATVCTVGGGVGACRHQLGTWLVADLYIAFGWGFLLLVAGASSTVPVVRRCL